MYSVESHRDEIREASSRDLSLEIIDHRAIQDGTIYSRLEI
jgi:hypothetical protein